MTTEFDHLAAVLRGRRTINAFLPVPPPEEALLRAIELARWAPNHKLTEPWRFHLLGPRVVAGIIDLNSRLIAAAKGSAAAEAKRAQWTQVPGWLAVTCQRNSDPLRSREDYAACCCALQNLMLCLWSEGIGAKWTTGAVTRHDEFASLVQLDPADREVVGLVWYGYPAQIPTTRRKGLDEIIVRVT